MNILISGAGIAGPTLAYWLAHYGFIPTIVESAPQLRTGGYLIDFWGAGFDIAERMSLLAEIADKGYHVNEVWVVNRSGKRTAGFSVDAISRATKGRFITLPRTALASAIFSKIHGQVETIFGDSVDRIDQTETGVQVAFKHHAPRRFDLVVGADSLHSRVRELIFGEEAQFEKYLGLKVAAFEAAGYRPRDELVNVMYTQVGQQVSRLAMRGDRTFFLFIFKDNDPSGTDTIQQQKTILRERFGNSGWECPQILAALDATTDLYFDRVSQIQMDPQRGLWTQQRVTLIGDAASSVSLLAGQGSALAMVAAYILAGELHRAKGDYALAFQRYQDLFAPFVLTKQKAALRFANLFAPKSSFSLFLRDRIFDLLAIPWIADLAIGRDLVDELALPDYSQPIQPRTSNLS